MRFRHCFFVAVIVIMLSLTAVAAGENITEVASGSDDDSTDLSVEIDVGVSHTDEGYNRAGSAVSWTITAKANTGTAHNTRVNVSLSDNQKIISSHKNVGSFNHDNGIWDIGDLTSNNNAILTIRTLLLEDGEFSVTAKATTDSNDTDLNNNYDSRTIESIPEEPSPHIKPPIGNKDPVPRKPAYTISTSDKGGADHNSHYASQSHNGIGEREVVDEEPAENDNGTSQLRGSVGETYQNNGDNNLNTAIIIFSLILAALAVIIGYRRVKS